MPKADIIILIIIGLMAFLAIRKIVKSKANGQCIGCSSHSCSCKGTCNCACSNNHKKASTT
ncbi:MAG: hypothetical protein PUG67_02950 [Peptoniphilaceae bacterium]|nr:hypothetical protein [Peptoniphilaceae bacterium]MDY6019032.1 hypothetical protein [Anaerococcus sp.]